MQKDTERGLISVEAEYVSAFKAKADGFSFAFHSKKLGGDVWDKTLDDEGKRHSFCFIKPVWEKEFFQIYKDKTDGLKYIKFDGYYYDEGFDAGRGTSRCVQRGGTIVSLEKFLEEKIWKDPDKYDQLLTTRKEYTEDMQPIVAIHSMATFYDDAFEELGYDDITMDTKCGCYVEV